MDSPSIAHPDRRKGQLVIRMDPSQPRTPRHEEGRPLVGNPGRRIIATFLPLLMKPRPPGDVTELLFAWGRGDEDALASLTPLVYGELHRLARVYMARERPGHPLQATALVNEAFLRLTDS